MKLALSKITIDPKVYPRGDVSIFNISRLVSALKAGNKLPPITIEARTHRLVDGRHRLEAHRQAKLATIEATAKVYSSEADLFADAVRLNIGHGQPLDQYNIRTAIVRLAEYGYSKQQVSEVVRMPIAQIEKIERGFANDKTGRAVALKGGLSHLAGITLTPQQLEVNKHYAGGKIVFYLRQIITLFEADMVPPLTQELVDDMERLIQLWRQRTSAASVGQSKARSGSASQGKELVR